MNLWYYVLTFICLSYKHLIFVNSYMSNLYMYDLLTFLLLGYLTSFGLPSLI